MIVITATAMLHDGTVACHSMNNTPQSQHQNWTLHELFNESVHVLDNVAQGKNTSIRIVTFTAEDLGKDGL